ncbi:MAG: RHS repeat-associated core domain-containing protein, partial [Actinomycetota bacterium]
QGDLTDPDTGTVDMGTRLYVPSLGRFSSRDVLFGESSDPMSMNQFAYAQGSPVTNWDPTGMGCLDDYGHMIGCTQVVDDLATNGPRAGDSGSESSGSAGSASSSRGTDTIDSPECEACSSKLPPAFINFMGTIAGWNPDPRVTMPAGVDGPFDVRTPGTGVLYRNGSGGGEWLNSRVMGIRFMDPNPNTPYPYYNYLNRAGQEIDPYTGRVLIDKNDPWWHRPLPKGFKRALSPSEEPPPDPPSNNDPPSGSGAEDGFCACTNGLPGQGFLIPGMPFGGMPAGAPAVNWVPAIA